MVRGEMRVACSGMRAGVLIQEQLTRSVIGAFFDVYNHLGFGFLEHLYVAALERDKRRATQSVVSV